MKKLLALLLAITCIASTAMMVGCDETTAPDEETTTEAATTAPETTEPETTENEETTDDKAGNDKPAEITTINGKTPYEFLMAAAGAIGENYEATLNMDASISMDSGSTSVDMKTTMLSSIKTDGQNIYEYSMTDMGDGEPGVSEMWYVGGHGYTQQYIGMDEDTYEDIYENVKVAVTPEQAANYYGVSIDDSDDSIADSLGADLPESVLADMKVSLTEDGLYAFELHLSDEEIITYADTLGLGDIIEEDYTITGFSYTFYVTKDGVMDSLVCNLTMSADDPDMGMEMAMTLAMTVEIKGVGTTVVTAPENADEYTEYTFEDLFGSIEDWEEDWFEENEDYEW